MRISDEQIENVARKLASPLFKKVQELRDASSKQVKEHVFSKIPKEVLSFKKLYPYSLKYFGAIKLYNESGRFCRYITETTVPNFDSSEECAVKLSDDDAAHLRPLVISIAEAERKYSELYTSIGSALQRLSSYGRVNKHFPTAYKVLVDLDKIYSNVRFSDNPKFNIQEIEEKLVKINNKQTK